MVTLRPSSARGHANHGWLDSHHTFSFSSYQDPRHMGFGALRVINEDRVMPAMGFGTHPHRDMEIVSYVVSGQLGHRDSMGNGSVILPGEVQLMSAGTGVTHSEMNPSKTEGVHFLQIWVIPAKASTTPRYDQRAIPKVENGFALLVSPDGAQGSVTIGQDARIWRLNLNPAHDARLPLAPGRMSWVQVIHGAVSVNGLALAAGDGAALKEESDVEVVASQESELLVFDLKAS